MRGRLHWIAEDLSEDLGATGYGLASLWVLEGLRNFELLLGKHAEFQRRYGL